MNVPIPFFAASRRSSGISAPWNARALLRLSPSSRRNRLRRAPPPVDVLHVGVASARAVDMFSTALASARDDLAPSRSRARALNGPPVVSRPRRVSFV